METFRGQIYIGIGMGVREPRDRIGLVFKSSQISEHQIKLVPGFCFIQALRLDDGQLRGSERPFADQAGRKQVRSSVQAVLGYGRVELWPVLQKCWNSLERRKVNMFYHLYQTKMMWSGRGLWKVGHWTSTRGWAGLTLFQNNFRFVKIWMSRHGQKNCQKMGCP